MEKPGPSRGQGNQQQQYAYDAAAYQQYWNQYGYPPQQIPPPRSHGAPRAEAEDSAMWLNQRFYEEAKSGFTFYEPEEWLPTLSMKISQFMFWPWATLSGLTLAATVYFQLFADEEHKSWVNMPLDAHVVMGGALSFLIVMRTDASMNRWWEARCAWSTIINCCISLGAQTAPILHDDEACETMLMQIMAFAISVKAHMRDEPIQRDEIGPRMSWKHCKTLNRSCNPPLIALQAIFTTVRENLPKDNQSLGSAIFDEVSEQIRVLNHAVGACKKIDTTPMTYGYVTTLRSFLILWLATLPMSLIGEFGWLAPPVLSFIAFLFINVEKMAVEIENPFGDDPNDLPQEDYIMQLQEQLIEMTPGYEYEEDDDDDDDDGWAAKNWVTPSALKPTGGVPATPTNGEAFDPRMYGWNNVSPAWMHARQMGSFAALPDIVAAAQDKGAKKGKGKK